MTANVEIITADKKGVLTVPNKALRFYVTDDEGKTQRYKDKGVWIMQNGKPTRLAVTIGISDDERTEIKSGSLKVGDKVIVEQTTDQDKIKAMRMRMPR